MLLSASHLTGRHLAATDGEIGRVRDFLLDDRLWAIRYMVADTGTWLPGRRVLISPVALREADWKSNQIRVSLTRQQIEDSPPLASDAPVSARYEARLHEYFVWPAYWGPPSPLLHAQAHSPSPAGVVESGSPTGDSHLRSIRELTGYAIAATDGDIGHVEDLILDDEAWWVRYLVVDTRNWLPGRKVLVSPEWARKVDWLDRAVALDLTRDQIRESPPYDPSAPVNRAYEEKIYDYYGRPVYWAGP